MHVPPKRLRRADINRELTSDIDRLSRHARVIQIQHPL
jgi:hypothetical protein